MSYHIDLHKISIENYKKMLISRNLLATRRVLKNGIDENFKRLSECGFSNIGDLYEGMDAGGGIEELSVRSDIDSGYLKILKKEIEGVLPKPVLISDFPYVSMDTVRDLARGGVRTSKDFYGLSGGCKNKSLICANAGITDQEAEELCGLCDLIRISGVGPVIARILYEAGFKSIYSIAGAEAGEIYDKICRINDERNYTRAILQEKELQFCIDFAGLMAKTEE